MPVSVVISVLVHGVILAVAFFGLPKTKEFDVKLTESVPVEIVDFSELTKLKAQSKNKQKPEPNKKPAPKKVEKAPEKPKTAEVEQKAPVKPSEPAPKPKKPEPAPEAVTPKPPQEKKPVKAEKKPDPKPKKKPEKPKQQAKKPEKKKPKPKPKKKEPEFQLDEIAALLDKTPEKKKREIKSSSEEDGIPELGDQFLQGTDIVVTRDERDALREQIEACWSPPVGAAGAEDLVVRLRIALKPDGTLQGPPQLLNSGSGAYFRAAADSAIRAVHICQPYEMPAEKYDAWKRVILNFDPRQMLGG